MRVAEEETRRLLDDLPDELRARARAIPVVFENRPGSALIASGIAPDTMGLFEGSALAEELGADPVLPRQIVLFLDVILDEAAGGEAAFRDIVRDTLLHELGHYLGLDEADLADRDLE